MKFIEYISYMLIPVLIIAIVVSGEKKKIKVYDAFVEGANEGFKIITKIFPTMLAVIVAVNIFNISGAMGMLTKIISPVTNLLKVPNEVVPLGLMRSVSGGGAVALLSDVLSESGPDSLVGRIASTIMGSSDTTLYVVAMYTGIVGINKTKGVLFIGLLCDFVAFMVAVLIWNFMI